MFFEDVLGMRTTEMIVLDSGEEAGVWVTATNKTYDVAFTLDHYGARGRFHHATYALDSREEILRAADIFLENGIHIETGPHKHAIQQTFFLYVYEPGGNRVEVANAGARLMLAPDWQPVVWTEAERKKGQAWGLKTIESFHTHGTPPIEKYTGPRDEMSAAEADERSDFSAVDPDRDQFLDQEKGPLENTRRNGTLVSVSGRACGSPPSSRSVQATLSAPCACARSEQNPTCREASQGCTQPLRRRESFLPSVFSR